MCPVRSVTYVSGRSRSRSFRDLQADPSNTFELIKLRSRRFVRVANFWIAHHPPASSVLSLLVAGSDKRKNMRAKLLRHGETFQR